MQLFRNRLRSYLLCLLMLCYGVGHAKPAWQKDAVITLQAQRITLGKIFKAILQQTGIKIMYAGKMVNEQEVYTQVQFKATKLEDALQYLFKGKGLEWIYRDEVIILRPKAAAVTVSDTIPALNISGRVLDESGAPLPGATVLVKGTMKGTAADALGNFRITGIPANAVLAVSFTGFEQQEIPLHGRAELALSLKRQVKEINKVEVFSTGYQDVPKERATGSFEFVNNEELNRRVGTDILSRLEGVTTSVFFDRRNLSPGQKNMPLNNVIIRGLSTLSDELKAPLVVVDNFLYEGNINNINPNDVENISILKDAAAASIWGARAANGVIVINTKKGQYNQPLRMSLNVNTGITEKPDLFHFKRMSSADMIAVESFLFNKGFYDATIDDPYAPVISPANEIFLKRRAGLISAADSTLQIDALKGQDVRNEFNKYIYRKAVSQQYALNLNGGSEKIRYSLSGGFDMSPSILRGNSYKRITLNSNNYFSPVKKLNIQFGIRYANAETKENSLGDFGAGNYDASTGIQLMPYTRFADANGKSLAIPRDYREGYTDTAGAGKLLDWKYRPLDELRYADNTSKEQEIVITTGISYEFARYLNFQVNYQYQYGVSGYKAVFTKQTYYARNLINSYTNLGATDPYLRNPVPVSGIMDEITGARTVHMGRMQLNFNDTWNDKHQVSALAGTEIRENINTGNSIRTYGYTEERLSSALMDFVTRFPLYGDRGNASIPSGANGYSKSTDHFVSLFGNAAYTYDNRYTLSASARRDAANQIGTDINDLWKPFWSVGGSWNISNESFYSFKPVPYLRARATFGYQGNVNNKLSPYTILSYSSPNSTSLGLPYASISTPANPDLSWETIRQINAGIDFRIAGNRISGSVDAYSKNSNNLIMRVPVDFTTGVSVVQKNIASMSGKGIDLLLRTVNIDGVFKWNTELGMSYVSNKVTDFTTAGSVYPLGSVVGGSGINIVPRIGITPYALFSYPFAGLDPSTGEPLGYLGGKVSNKYLEISNQSYDTASVIYHGSAIPTVFGNFNNTFTYRGFSLNINISYRLGYYFRKNTLSYFALFNYGTGHADYSRRWQQPGDEKNTTVPSMIYPVSDGLRDAFYNRSSVNALRGDNIRLQYIRLGYDLADAFVRKLHIRELGLYLNIDNLGILWRANKEGLDPDYSSGDARYISPRVITLGARLNF